MQSAEFADANEKPKLVDNFFSSMRLHIILWILSNKLGQYLGGLLHGPKDRMISHFKRLHNEKTLAHLAEDPTRLADEITARTDLPYEAIERVAPE